MDIIDRLPFGGERTLKIEQQRQKNVQRQSTISGKRLLLIVWKLSHSLRKIQTRNKVIEQSITLKKDFNRFGG